MRGARAKERRNRTSAPPAPRRRLRSGLVGLAVAVAVGVPAAWALLGDDDTPALPPPAPAPPAPPAEAVAPPETPPEDRFRVVYRVEDTGGEEMQVSTDLVSVRRPFDVRLEHREGAPPGGEVASSTVTNARFRFNSSRGEERFVTRQVPGPLALVASVEVLEAAADAGAAERLGDATVAGEPCTRYAYLMGGNELLAKSDDQSRVEVCVTPDSILLSEATTLGGRQIRLLEAVEVDRDPSFTPETFLTDREPSEEEDVRLLETVQRVTDGPPRQGIERVGVSVPEGFTRARQAIVGRQLGPGSPAVELFVQSFQRGTEFVAVEELLTTRPDAPWPEDEGVPVDLGKDRSGRVVYRSSAAEVRVMVGDEFVRVSSARPELALAVARTLVDPPSEAS
ncbi:MAG: hypothetical protein ACRDY7_16745 [Acidimicrobiia bacterium]